MQPDSTKILTFDMDSKNKVLTDALVNALYGEHYRQKISNTLSQVNYIVTGTNKEAVSGLKILQNNGVINDADEKIEVFQKEIDDYNKKIDVIKNQHKEVLEQAAKELFKFCQEKNIDFGMFETEEDVAKTINCGSDMWAVQGLLKHVASNYNISLPSVGATKEQINKVKETELWQKIESLGILEKNAEAERQVADVDNKHLLTEANEAFVKDLNMCQKETLNKFIRGDLGTGATAAAVTLPSEEGDIYSFLSLPINGLEIDHLTIHEIIHILEFYIIQMNLDQKTWIAGSGFNIQKESLESEATQPVYESEEEEQKIEKYLALNEAIVDRYASKVVEYLQKNNITIMGDNQTYKSAYSTCFPYCGELIDLMQPDLIKYRMSSNPKAFFEYFGQENTDMLADTVYYFMYECRPSISSWTSYLNEKYGTDCKTKEDIVANIDTFKEEDDEYIVNLLNVKKLKEHYLYLKKEENKSNE